ncbi:mitochondrial 54S ribosomal protein bL32m [Limtongia smithiae]|uniref:mitochondrial 54S ribosomal protein bL32m n=1 Tax=Limtongia smithiae TaxID=1125753 RepID=UPI0034CFBA3E
MASLQRPLLANSWLSRLSGFGAALRPRDTAWSSLLATPLLPAIVLRLPLPSDLGLGLGSNPFGIVFAVPKKKVSLRRRRMRQLAPGDKHIKPVESLCECPSCGRVKRAHTVCGPCHEDVKNVWRAENGSLHHTEQKIPESIHPEFLDIINEKLTNVPRTGKFLSDLSREENNKKKPPMFEWEKLHKKSGPRK